MTNTRGPV